MDYQGSLQLLARSVLDVEATFSCVLSAVTVAACHAQNLATGSPGLNANPSCAPPQHEEAQTNILSLLLPTPTAQIKGSIVAFLHGCRDWDWPASGGYSGGRAALPPDFLSDTRLTLVELVSAQSELLLLPITSRTRNVVAGVDAAGERQRSAEALQGCDERIEEALDRLSLAVETMKAAGLPGNEASRLRQYLATVMMSWEAVRSIKKYRTPQTTRAFSRIYALLHPLFMGPYYAHVAGTVSDIPAISLFFALGLAVATSLCLSALFSTRYRLEDPFAEGETDTINVREELGDLVLKVNRGASSSSSSAD